MTEAEFRKMFPRASVSTLAANPHLAGQKVEQNDSTGILSAPKANRGASMNATERSYTLMLEAMKRAGDIADWKFESVKLRLADGCYYIPDFMVIETLSPLKIKFVEIKGFLRDDARVKFLTAKEIHHWAEFEMLRKTKDGWQRIL